MNSLNPYRTGERVRITIDATVTWSDSGEIEYEYRSQLGTVEAKAALDSDAVKVERIAPAEWPPRPGDLWRDSDGDPWFTVTDGRGGVAGLVFIQAAKNDRPSDPDSVINEHGPLTLVHREATS